MKHALGLALYAVVVAYLAAVTSDLALQAQARPSPRRFLTPQLYMPDTATGYRLTPGADVQAPCVDGCAPWRVRTDEVGRVTPGQCDGPLDTLVVGDSFAFGALLAEDETAPAVAARLSGRAYRNAGVPGYDASQTAVALERLLRTLVPRRVVYLFFQNDLVPPSSFVSGQVREVTALDLAAALRLATLRHPPSVANSQPAASVRRAVRATETMRAACAQHGVTYEAWVIPAVEETETGLTAGVELYQAATRARAFVGFERADYWPHDPHLRACGAQKVARQLIGSQ